MRQCPRDKNCISELPDEVIAQILSLLPIKDAVKTSVLSRDWEHKWTFMLDIKISDGKTLYQTNMPRFINFVYKVLTRTCNSALRRFSLRCHEIYHPSYLEMWISMALTRNVESLDIFARKVPRLDSRWCFSGWTLLTELRIHLSCTLVIPLDSYCFSKLKRLRLASSHGNLKLKTPRIPKEGRMVLNFPVLELLSLKRCEWVDVNFVEIHAPEMMNFSAYCLEEEKSYEIKIFAAKVARFELHGGSIENFDLHTLAAVSHAAVSYKSTRNREEYLKTFLPRFHKVLEQVSGVKCLKLQGEIAKSLIPSSKSGFVFPTFGRLEELHLCSRCYVKDTMNVLQVLQPLESLTIEVAFWKDDCNSNRGEPWPPRIVSKLKSMKLTYFSGTNVQFDFSKFVLENAMNLAKMLVFVGWKPDTKWTFLSRKPHTTMMAVREKLSTLKPESSSSQIGVWYMK